MGMLTKKIFLEILLLGMEDLQLLLDNAVEGVIYFSMGSILESSALPVDKLNQLLDVFRGVKQTILWKFEEELTSAPKNVHMRPWFPQASILAHKNLRIFITHGGILSITEAIHFGVPLIGIPVYVDQPMHMDRAIKEGYALKVDIKSPHIGKYLGAAIKAMIHNQSYAQTAKRVSQRFHDRPTPPAHLVPYWTESVIRTGGAQHIRTAASSILAYQRYLLDIIVAMVAALGIAVYILRTFTRRLFGSIA